MKIFKSIILILCTFTLFSCGDSDPQDTTVPTDPSPEVPVEPSPVVYHDITVIDGYIRGAIAFVDLNNNKVLDNEEPWIETGINGYGQIDITDLGVIPEGIQLVVNIPAGAIDENTIDEQNPEGIAFIESEEFTLQSLPGGNVATPLTTLINMNIIEGDVDTAISEFADKLNMSVDDVTGDYIEAENAPLTVLTELMVANDVLPNKFDESINISNLVKANAVTGFLAETIEVANTANTLSNDNEALATFANQISNNVELFISNTDITITEENLSSISTMIEAIGEATFEQFSELVVEESNSPEILQNASTQSQVIAAVMQDLLVDSYIDNNNIAETELTKVKSIIAVFKEDISLLVTENSDVSPQELITIVNDSVTESYQQIIDLIDSGSPVENIRKEIDLDLCAQGSCTVITPVLPTMILGESKFNQSILQ